MWPKCPDCGRDPCECGYEPDTYCGACGTTLCEVCGRCPAYDCDCAPSWDDVQEDIEAGVHRPNPNPYEDR